MLDYARGSRIAELRKKLNMGQDELAHRIGISRAAMSNIENGADFKISRLGDLADALHTTAASLLYGQPEKKDDLIDEIGAELAGLDELELRRMLAAVRAVKAVA